jgi:D-alanine-D-alanine ligase
MNIEFDPDWWKTLFDDIYLITDARSVGDERLTRKEVDLICRLLDLQPEDRILDLCGGQGRHSLELCRRGFARCTVLDFSPALIRIGAELAKRMGCAVAFHQGDARSSKFPSRSFDHVLIMGNSLGYAGDMGADLEMLAEARRLLAEEGRLLIDVTNGRAVKKHFRPNAWHEIGEDIVVCRQRELKPQMICAREMVIHKKGGLLRDSTYGMHLYEPASLRALAADAGFERIHVLEDFRPYEGDGDVGFMDHRIILTAQKIGLGSAQK